MIYFYFVDFQLKWYDYEKILKKKFGGNEKSCTFAPAFRTKHLGEVGEWLKPTVC